MAGTIYDTETSLAILALPALGSADNLQRVNIYNGSRYLRQIIATNIGNTGTVAYFRLLQAGNQIFPTFGGQFIPQNFGSGQEYPVEVTLNGPPSDLTLEAYNPHASTTTSIAVVITCQHSSEADLQLRQYKKIAELFELIRTRLK